MPDPGPLVGSELEVEVGPPAHGGFCVARYEGRVYFVRHALPGERVRLLVTEDRGSFCRADAVEILEPSADRVVPPCPHAGPGRCGGCDWQHASGDAQRELKASVVREQFTRLAGIDVSGLLSGVEAMTPDGELLGWRTRITYAVGPDGWVGLRRHRSHEIERIASCPLGAAGIGDSRVLAGNWTGQVGVEVARGDGPEVVVLGHQRGPRRQGRGRGRRSPDEIEVLDGPSRLRHTVRGRQFETDASGFWQVHPASAETFVGAVIEALRPRTGESALDLYSGAGTFTAALAQEVGHTGTVLGIESSGQAVADAERNLADLSWARVRRGRVNAALLTALDTRPDIVVLDPPRAGAGAATVAALLALRPRAVGYVACDPAALARDTAAAMAHGWRLSRLRAFDAFPMTHHVECVAVLEPCTGLSDRPAAVVVE